jgi:alpha-tubulin suppressor-like RCC1 family protein
MDSVRGGKERDTIVLPVIACGDDHTAVLAEDGSLYTWGSNEDGQLGHDACEDCEYPVRVEGVERLGSLICGHKHTAALTDYGTLYTWGNGEYGRLGHGDDLNVGRPQMVESPELAGIHVRLETVHSGEYHVAALTADGAVFTWGDGEFGQLGHGEPTGQGLTRPTRVRGLESIRIVSLACGAFHSVVVAVDRTVWTWGNGSVGSLGMGSSRSNTAVPVQVKSLDGASVVQVACGARHTLALTQDGILYSWGYGKFGQLGLGHKRDMDTPTQVQLGDGETWRVASIACGTIHSVASTRNGSTHNGALYAWGCGRQGRLGHGNSTDYTVPKRIEALTSYVYSAACGDVHTAVLTEDGVHTFGSGEDGRLGHGDDEDLDIPRQVQELADLPISGISCGADHSSAVTNDGYIYLWGNNDHGQLGFGHIQPMWEPTRLPSLQGFRVTKTICGNKISSAITQEGVLYLWGSAANGKLGNGRASRPCLMPTMVEAPELAGVHVRLEMIDSGEYHSAALTHEGVVLTWGDSEYGQLGQGDNSESIKPLPVKGLVGLRVTSLACGDFHTTVVTSSGDLYTWGDNSIGSLGLGNYINQNSPQRIALEDRVVTVESGIRHTLALTQGGDVYSWGYGKYGQLGQGTTQNCATPVKIEVQGVSYIACGSIHSAASTLSGALYTWGCGRQGRLGHGDSADQLKPKLVEALDGIFVHEAACGTVHSAILADDGVYTCGDGDFGRLGLGHDDVVFVPTKVEALDGVKIVPRARKLRDRKELMRRGSNYGGSSGSTRGLDIITPPRDKSPRQFQQGVQQSNPAQAKLAQQTEALKDIAGKVSAVTGAATGLFKRGKLGSM